MMRIAALVALAFSLCGTAMAGESPPAEADRPSTEQSAPASIGVVTMLQDKSIMIGIRSRNSTSSRADAVLVLQPGDLNYQTVIDHVGGLMPGETKNIPPYDAPAKEPGPSPKEESPARPLLVNRLLPPAGTLAFRLPPAFPHPRPGQAP